MAVKCGLRKATGAFSGREVIFPEVANFSRISEDDFVSFVVANCQVGRAQVMSVLNAVEEQLVNFMMQGHSVEVPRLGTFSLTVDGRVEKDESGHWQLTDAKPGRVALKPAVTMLKKLRNTKFELIGHTLIQRTQLPDEQAIALMRRLCEESGFFTVQTYSRAAGHSFYIGKKTIEHMLAAGKLVEGRTGRTRLYRMA